MKRKRNQLFVTALTAAMAVSLLSPAEPAAAAKKVKFNVKKLSLTVGKKKTLKIKNAKKKAKWSIKSGKDKIKLQKKKKASVVVAAKKAGSAKVQAKVGKKKYVCKVVVKAKTVEFVDQSRTTGMITPENYLTYANSIGMTGNYTIQLEHRAKVAFPDEESSNASYKIGFRAFFRDEILNEMFDNNESNDYLMSNGDYLTVTVTSQAHSFTNSFMRLFTGQDATGVSISYGGYVGNTGGAQ